MHKSIFVIIASCLYASVGYAQLFVGENSTLTIASPDATLSTNAQAITINSHIQGNGTLLLNNVTTTQHIKSSATALSIPNLNIANADYLSLDVAIQIANSLTLQSGTLHLTQPLTLNTKESLILQASAKLSNNARALIYYQYELNPKPLNALVLQTQYIPIALPQTSPKTVVNTSLIPPKVKPIKDSFTPYSYYLSITSPPPES